MAMYAQMLNISLFKYFLIPSLLAHDSSTGDWTLCEIFVKYCAFILCSKLLIFISAVLIFHIVQIQSV